MKPITGKTARKRISKELLALPHGGIELIATERARQISVEGFDATYDVAHTEGQLSVAAACYAVNHVPIVKVITGNYKLCADAFPAGWDRFDKRGRHDRLRSLVIAGALIAAEIDRLQAQEGK